MTVKEFNNSKIPLVEIDKKLNKFQGKVLFKEKLEMANKLLENAVLPKTITERQ